MTRIELLKLTLAIAKADLKISTRRYNAAKKSHEKMKKAVDILESRLKLLSKSI